MRLTVRKAKIPDPMRIAFERYGPQVMQQLLAVGGTFRISGQTHCTEGEPVNPPLLAWLTEQHDIQDRKETVTTLMEAGILALVFTEVIFSLANFFGCGHAR